MMWILFKVFLLFIWLLCSSNNGAYANDNDFTHSHIVSVSDLLPPTVCNRTRTALPQGPGKASLEVVSKYGPCSRLNKGISTHTPPLRKGRQRFHSENSRRLQKAIPHNYMQKSKSFQFPAKINNTAVDEYYIVVAIGEPKQYISLLLDIGSDLTWTQCKPCIHCSQQRDPFFDPSKSKTFSKIPCNSASCRILRKLLPPNGQDNCSSEECPYNIAYADNSSDGGFWAADRITIQEANRDGYFSWYPFLLGCTNNNTSDQNGASGIMGLDRSPISIISQTNTSYFSYCLPSPYGSTGYITFGRPDAVNTLRSAFRKRMMKYKKTKADDEDDFDTCYDLSAYETVVVPKITFHFLGGVDLELDVRGTLVVFSVSQVCLAFAIFPSDPNSISLGNVQQRGYEVHYDVAGRRLGFGPGNCS
ncbi:hypothetical protein AB3S75_016232 [Citrus x aurantiifolia]